MRITDIIARHVTCTLCNLKLDKVQGNVSFLMHLFSNPLLVYFSISEIVIEKKNLIELLRI